MQRKTASTVEGCSYSFLCVAKGRPSRYSSAWVEDEADIVADVGKSEFVYRRTIMFVKDSWNERDTRRASVAPKES